MDIRQIPPSFWYALSFCMVVATIGLLYLALMSTSVSIEIANARIQLSSAISQTKDVMGEIEKENTRLVAANQELQQRIRSLEARARESVSGVSLHDLESLGLAGQDQLWRSSIVAPKDQLFNDWKQKIRSAEKSLKLTD